MVNRFVLAFAALSLAAGNAAAQERQWSLDAGGEDAYLIFGVPETDDVGVSLWCPVQSGEVGIFVPEPEGTVKAGEAVTMVIKAGDVTARLSAKPDISAETGAATVEAKTPADDPLFGAMQSADRFYVSVGSNDAIFPLADADIGGLLELCRKP